MLAYLAPRVTEVLQALAAMQVASETGAISYAALKDACIKKMLTSNDLSLRNIIKELSTHKIIGSKGDSDGTEQMFILPSISIRDILSFSPKEN